VQGEFSLRNAKMLYMRNVTRLTISALLATAPCAHAALNDVFPADYAANPEGTTTAKFFLFDRYLEGPYKQGAKKIDGELHNTTAALQFTHFAKLGNYTVAPLAVISWGNSETSPASLNKSMGKSASGFGDLRMGATLWLYNNPQLKKYVAVTAHVLAPTGSYDPNQIINIGENRWRYVLGAGWIKPLGKSLHLNIAPEIAFYGKNDQFNHGHTLEQSHSYSLTGSIGYRMRPTFYLSIGGQINRGGETRLDGVDQNNPINSSGYSLGVVYFQPDKKNQWILRYAHGTNIENGFLLQDEIALRYATAF